MTNAAIFLGNPVLKTDRLLLRRYKHDDTENLFRIYSNPEVGKYITWETCETLEDTEAFINEILEMYDSDDTGEWAVTLADTGRLIGSCGFAWCDMQHACAQVGFLLDPAYWRKGLATEALKAVLDFGFNSMGLNRIEGFHISGNEASGRVMEKASMRLEGILREKIFMNGSYLDLSMYASLKKYFNRINDTNAAE